MKLYKDIDRNMEIWRLLKVEHFKINLNNVYYGLISIQDNYKLINFFKDNKIHNHLK